MCVLVSYRLFTIITFSCAHQVERAWHTRNYDNARRLSKTTNILNIIAFAIGFLIWIGAIVAIGTTTPGPRLPTEGS